LHVDQLFHVSAHDKFTEIFGWQPAIWGALFFVVAGLMALTAAMPPLPLEGMISGGSAAVGLCLAGYEVHRRRNRSVLVKDVGNIAVYRKGCLDLVLDPDEISVVKANLVSMLNIGLPLGLCAAMFTFVGLLGLLRDEAAVADNLMILSLGVACGASLASAAWTRFRYAHLRVPVKGSRWLAEETVMISSSRLKELFA